MKILVTGGTNGMGKGVAKVLAGADNQSHEIIILCRSEQNGKALIKEFENETGSKNTSIVLCDLTKLSDVRKAYKEIKSNHDYLDGIFINAGIGYAASRIETIDGMDSHFQVNYLSQFMLTLNLLDLLEKSTKGGRVIFNATKYGEIKWDDMQLENKWSYESGIIQAMAAKRMFAQSLNRIYQNTDSVKLSFVCFSISETVWTNQLNIIPTFMRIMATLMKYLGKFISMERCGEIMSPLFLEDKKLSMNRSGNLITFKKGAFLEMIEDERVLDEKLQDKLWDISLKLINDEETKSISDALKR